MELELAIVLAVFVISTPNGIICSEMNAPNTDGWLDPDDIFIHHRLKEVRSHSLKSNPTQICDEKLKACLMTISDCEKRLKEAIITSKVKGNQPGSMKMEPLTAKQYCEKPVDNDNDNAKLYMKRFVNMLLKVIAANDGSKEEVDQIINFNLVISTDQITILRRFSEKNEVSLPYLDETLSQVFVVRSRLFDLNDWSVATTIINYFKDFTFSSEMWSFIVCILLPCAFFFFITIKTKSIIFGISCFILTVFFSTYMITAQKMILEASVVQSEHLSCESSSQNERCEQLSKENRIPFHLKVTSLAVLSKMFGETFTDIAKHSGSSVVHFVSAFREFGFFEMAWAIPLGLGVTAIMVTVLCGGSLNLPFYLGRIDGSRSKKVQGGPDSQMLQSAPGAEPTVASKGNNITFNFNRSGGIDDFKEVLYSVMQTESVEHIAGKSASPRHVKNISFEKGEHNDALEGCRIQSRDLSAGDSAQSCTEKALCTKEATVSHGLSGEDVFRFTAPQSHSRWGRYRSGKPPKKVQILERTRHKSL